MALTCSAVILPSQRNRPEQPVDGGTFILMPGATAVRCGSSGRRKSKLLRRLLLAAALLLVFSEGSAMGLFTRMVLFSPVSGVVLKDGVPELNAWIGQATTCFDQNILPQSATSDASGRFRFFMVGRRAGLSRFVPHPPVIKQTIIITHGAIEYEAWRHTKARYEENSKLGVRSLNLECALPRETVFQETRYRIDRAVGGCVHPSTDESR